MRELTVDEAQTDLTSILNQVCQAGTQVIIRQPNGNDVILMPLSDYRGLEETLHLLSSTANASRLNESIGQSEFRKK